MSTGSPNVTWYAVLILAQRQYRDVALEETCSTVMYLLCNLCLSERPYILFKSDTSPPPLYRAAHSHSDRDLSTLRWWMSSSRQLQADLLPTERTGLETLHAQHNHNTSHRKTITPPHLGVLHVCIHRPHTHTSRGETRRPSLWTHLNWFTRLIFFYLRHTS